MPVEARVAGGGQKPELAGSRVADVAVSVWLWVGVAEMRRRCQPGLGADYWICAAAWRCMITLQRVVGGGVGESGEARLSSGRVSPP